MKIKIYTTLLLVCSVVSISFAQEGRVKRATKIYDKLSYVKTSEVLLEVAEKGYKSVDLFQKLGNSFYFNNKMEDAAKWYGELMALGEEVDAEYYFRYAQALKFTENYEEADKWMQKFVEASSSDLRAKSFASKRDYLESIEKVSQDFPIKNMEINSELSDFGANQYKNQFLFASTRGEGKIYDWNEQPFLDLYSAKKDAEGDYRGVIKFDEAINTKFHESTISFLPNDQIAYFTRNNYFKKRARKDRDGFNRLQIFRAKFQNDGTWGDIESVHFNSRAYSTAHPAVNVHGDKLYFASDMPGTIGNSDIFVVTINPDATLGEPMNLGKLVNTEGHETFPFVNEKGDLFYSSNGFNGLGGLDVYVIRDFENKLKNKQPFVVENLGKPINSAQDDFGYYENLGTKEGFFTSNRPGGKGDDDIYQFTIPECNQTIEGVVYDKDTKNILPGATVTLYDKDVNQINQIVVGEDASYSFTEINCEAVFLVRAEKENYSSSEIRVETTSDPKEYIKVDHELAPDKVELVVGDNLREKLDLNPIYFDFDKSNIRPDAEIELQKVIAVLKAYPLMKIDVRSHTDSRAPYLYNEALSSRRNKSTIKYIIEVGGIDASRLTGRGYGEEQLVNKCSDGVDCTEEEHQLNRRSDFIIISTE